MTVSHIALLSATLLCSTTHAFTFTTSQPSRVSLIGASTPLHATANKKKKQKNKKSPPAGGGFGSPTARKETPPKSKSKGNTNDDGAVAYPELEPKVLQTLIPSPLDDVSNENLGNVLSEEMYDRLEEIYGLEQFNFGGEGAIYKSIGVADKSSTSDNGDNDAAGSLFDDILSGGSSSSGSSALDDLLSPSSTSTAPISLDDIFDSDSKSNDDTESAGSSSSFDLNSIPPFTKFRVLHTDPMVLAIDDFFTPEECDRYVQVSIDSEQENDGDDANLQPMLIGQSQTVGKDSRSEAQRTSTTWFHYYEGVPELMAKASRLLGLEGIGRFEEPQTVRYRKNEKFTWHLDALSPEESNDASGAGQRMATLLVYLTDVAKEDGGATMFRDLGGKSDEPLKVRPKKGSALLFSPAAGGIPDAPFDIRTLHCGEAVSETAENEKWIAQLWLRQRDYKPTAPAGNVHGNASDAIGKYCDAAKA